MATDWKLAPKDPQDVRDYAINWAADLPTGVTVVSGVATVSSGDVVISQQSHAVAASVVRLSGGTVTTAQLINFHVVLSDGEELDLDAALVIKDRKV